ncbi:AsnC family transcriptional regulator [Yoonia maricola]|uniref:AsnC family transcriptional regulator n=1 Tax=Yoonia maricola TaxID=420999 RepID=A0A2M8W656_9RHOB|nr:Lrp/AsnC family transcriptional regulator [Yoonia maricola]PJI86413.1 AsnC family transcriptional regulator [Yoonia maricola]
MIYTAFMSKSLDQTDCAIITILEQDGRASLAEIAKEVALTGPAVGERLRRMREIGQISGFSVRVDLRALGYTIQALVRIKPRSGQLQAVERMIADQPRFMSCDRVTGDDCYVARLALADVAELDDILLPFHDRAETHTAIVKSSIFEDRLPPLTPLA